MGCRANDAFIPGAGVGTSANDLSDVAGVDIFNYPLGFRSSSFRTCIF